MTSRVITRYRCDWCGTRAEVGHGASDGTTLAAPLPPFWGHVAIEGREEDLCKLCSESLVAVLRAGPDLSPAPATVAALPARPSARERAGSVARRVAATRPPRPPFARWVSGLRFEEGRRPVRDRVAVSALCAVLALVAVVGVTMSGRVPVIFATSEPAHTATPASLAAAQPEGTQPAAATTAPDEPAAASLATPAPDGAALAAPVPGPADGQPAPTTDARVTAVGDSVMLAAAEDLKRALGTVEIDAAVGRQAPEALEVLRAQRTAGTLGEVVVLHIGDNGPLEVRQVEEMLQLVAEVPTVLVVTLHVPRPWEAANNAILADVTSRYPNAALVDWAGASAERPELFWDDQIHLTPPGAEAYANLVSQQLHSASSTRQSALTASTPAASPTASATPASTATPTPTPGAAAATPAGATLAVTAEQATQVRIYVDGAVVYSGVLRAGETRSWAGSNEVRLWTDNGATLRVTVNGYDLGPLAAAIGHPDWNTIDWSWSADWRPR